MAFDDIPQWHGSGGDSPPRGAMSPDDIESAEALGTLHGGGGGPSPNHASQADPQSGVSESAPAWEAPAEHHASGSLAARVVSLRVLEDEIATLIDETERALRTLEAERTLEDAGFRSAEEFAERVAGQVSVLREMRSAKGAAPAATGRVRRRFQGRAGGDMRARRTRALAAIEQAMARLREVDVALRGKVDEARTLLAGIDRERTYAECGYTSFDEFLELAIGPSPILTRCLTVLGELPPPPEPDVAFGSGEDSELPSFADPPAPRPADDGPPALFELPPEPLDAPAAETSSPAELPEGVPRPLPARSALVVSVVMALAAAVLGAAAGGRSSQSADVPAAEAEAAPSPPPAHRAALPAPPGSAVPLDIERRTKTTRGNARPRGSTE
jgi:hypothetical protein